MNDQADYEKRLRDAGKLLARALQARLTPAQDPAYAELITAYRAEPVFRETVALIAEGMGLSVAADSQAYGLIVVARVDGPFISKMRDFQESMTQKDRITYGLLCVALAAYVFPSAEALDGPMEEAPPRVELLAAVPAVRALCEQALQGWAATEPEAGEYRLGAQHLLALREVSRTGDRSTLQAMLRRVCEHHVETGLFQAEPTRGGAEKGAELPPTYRPRPHYRVHVQHLASSGHRALLTHFQTGAPS